MKAQKPNTKFVKLKESDVAGIADQHRIDYSAPNQRVMIAELSILNHPQLSHLTFLPPPTVTRISPRDVEITVPDDVFVKKIDRAELRATIWNTVMAYSGIFINGMRVSWLPRHANAG